VFDYISSLEWIRAQSNPAIIGPAGTGKSHTVIGLGIAAIHAGQKVQYFAAAPGAWVGNGDAESPLANSVAAVTSVWCKPI
jgi:hypothetical protein